MISFFCCHHISISSFTTFACSTAGAAPLAAHQIVLNIFCIFAIFGDAVSQMSQTYLPGYFGFKTITKNQFSDGQTVIQRIMKISFVTGVLNCMLSYLAVSQFGPNLFTKSKEVNTAMVSIVVCLAASGKSNNQQLLHNSFTTPP